VVSDSGWIIDFTDQDRTMVCSGGSRALTDEQNRWSSWRDGTGYGLHEVYYDNEGRPIGMTPGADQVRLRCRRRSEGSSAVADHGDADASKRPVLDEPGHWVSE
jgi:hypothetical protein